MTLPESINDLTPLINVRVKMSKDMMRALNLYETICVVQKIKLVSEDQIVAFLIQHKGAEFAAKFRREYMLVPQSLE